MYDDDHTGALRLLFSPVIVMMSSLIVEIAGVFNRNLISLRGLVFAIALLEHFPGDTHCVNVCGFGFWGKYVLEKWACDTVRGR